MLEGEYKMMGLAPYGKPIYKKKIQSEILLLKKDGKYKLNIELCDYHSALKGKFNQKLISLFGKPRFKDENPSQNHIDLACSVQAAFEDCLIHLLGPVTKYYPQLDLPEGKCVTIAYNKGGYQLVDKEDL